VLGVTFAALAAWSWGRWTDPLIDFGFELYVPWRIGEGEALYRDIAYRNGPLSAYWNALLFAAFGVSVRTLVLANLATLALITALLFGSIERSLSRLGALVGCAAFLAICGFSQYGTVGNYNFVTPYQHGQTHGLALGLALVALLAGAAPTGGLGRWIGAGGVLGLLVLTKVELSLPAFAVAGCAAALEWRRCGKAANRHLTAMAGAALVPPLAALGLLSLAMPAGAAWQGVLGIVPYLAQALFEDPFYRSTAGLDAPGASLLAIAVACAVIAAIGLLLRLCDERARPVVASRGGLLAAAVVLGGAAGSLVPLPWDAAARALPVAMALAVARWAPAAGRGEPAARTGLLLAVFALLLLAKLGLATQVQHYGFALAAPALALGAAGAVHPWRSTLARSLSIALVAAFAGSLLTTSHALYRVKDHPLGSGADRILVAGSATSPRGVLVERLLRGLDALMPADATLLVLPEGAGINYWLRRDNPTPYSLFLPTEQAAHGGLAMLEALQATPPDFVVLVHRGHEEFGTGPFLSDPRYGQALGRWLAESYTMIEQLGATPFQGPAFGIVILRRAQAP